VTNERYDRSVSPNGYCKECGGIGYRWEPTPAGLVPAGHWHRCQGCDATGHFDQKGKRKPPPDAEPAALNQALMRLGLAYQTANDRPRTSFRQLVLEATEAHMTPEVMEKLTGVSAEEIAALNDSAS
jgi:hypothetical protein